jgi:hypothetical protein
MFLAPKVSYAADKPNFLSYSAMMSDKRTSARTAWA